MKYIGYEILYDKKYKKWFIISATGPKYLSSHSDKFKTIKNCVQNMKNFLEYITMPYMTKRMFAQTFFMQNTSCE
jgi:hypothetical protein